MVGFIMFLHYRFSVEGDPVMDRRQALGPQLWGGAINATLDVHSVCLTSFKDMQLFVCFSTRFPIHHLFINLAIKPSHSISLFSLE